MSERMRERQKTRRLFEDAARKTLARPERLTVTEWAEKYRVLDETSAIPGKFNISITPYMREIMDSFNDPYIQEINFCKPTQVGGTTAAENAIGWIVHQNPSPTMIVYPSDDLAKDISNDRIKPMFRKSEELKKRFYENASKEMNLRFKGCTVYLRGAGSPGKLASKAIKYLFFDEIDKMGGASKKEASPYNLAKERTKTFKWGKKIYTCSTPTLKTNYVWILHEAAEEQRHYVVPCPHCGEYIELKWKQVIFDKDPDEKMSNEERSQTAIYICQECGCAIENKEKPNMLIKGKWIPVKKTSKGKSKSVSFWLNALYSIFVSWEDMALEFLKTKDDPEEQQNFVNSWLAEPWEDTRLKTTEDLVMERQTNIPEFVVPSWAKLLTMGVDVQETSLYYVIRAFGDFTTSQKVTCGQVLSFSDIERLGAGEFKTEDGQKMTINLALIDSGYQADDTYDFCIDNSDWALPCKGSSNPMRDRYKISKVDKINSKAYGMQLVLVSGDQYKNSIAARMQRPNGSGSWMVHAGCNTEYAKQVTAEHKISIRNANGTKQTKWVLKNSHADNHYLDCEVYAMAAAEIMGVRSLHLQSQEAPQETKIKEERYAPEENWIQQQDDWIGG